MPRSASSTGHHVENHPAQCFIVWSHKRLLRPGHTSLSNLYSHPKEKGLIYSDEIKGSTKVLSLRMNQRRFGVALFFPV